jgi:hypothetical protein
MSVILSNFSVSGNPEAVHCCRRYVFRTGRIHGISNWQRDFAQDGDLLRSRLFHTQKAEWNKEQTLNLALGLQNIRKQIESCPSEIKRNELLVTQQKIRDAIKKLNTISSNLVFNLDKNEAASVEVIERIFPGVYIEICHIPFVVKKQMTNIRFFLDKATGTIKSERLR